MYKDLSVVLERNGYRLYPDSIRQIDTDSILFVVSNGNQKFVGITTKSKTARLEKPVRSVAKALESGKNIDIYELSWQNYLHLTRLLPIAPSACNSQASFGTGDRLGMVTAAHLFADGKYPIFPIIAQQSPRELERTDRSFKSVLLDAAMGVMETGWTGAWGADADHIKDEDRFQEGIDAGFTMYTLDVSDDLQTIDNIRQQADALSERSRNIVQKWAGTTLAGHTFSTNELVQSAIIYEKAMNRVKRFDSIARGKLGAYDLEVSIDEGARDTTPEDHLFVTEYLHGLEVDFTSLAPKFPGQFQKAVDYRGDKRALEASFKTHAEMARKFGNYRLSLHSGSDKFSIYGIFAGATEGNYHIKTSGTSWLQAVNLIAHRNRLLFNELYGICLTTLPESKKAYSVDI